MKRFILLTVIAILANVGMAVQIKNIGQHHANFTTQKMLSEVEDVAATSNHANFTAQKLLSEVEVVAATSQSSLTADDYINRFNSMDEKSFKDQNQLTTLNNIKSANDFVQQTFQSLQSATTGLKAIASISKVASFALPASGLVLSLLINSQSNPQIEAIKTQISNLQNTVENNHKETQKKLDQLSEEICKTEMKGYFSTLETMIENYHSAQQEYIRIKSQGYPFNTIYKVCGDNLGDCQNAITKICKHFPTCLDNIIKASVFNGGDKKLEVRGDMQYVQPHIDAVLNLLGASLNSYLFLVGYHEANQAKEIKSISKEQMTDIKIISNLVNKAMQQLLQNIHSRLPNLTDYTIVDWAQKKIGHTGVGGIFDVPQGYAIVGFYKHRGQQLIDLTKVLAGKGLLGHGGYPQNPQPNFREKFKTTHDRKSPHEARSPSCDKNYVLRGFNIEPRRRKMKGEWVYYGGQMLEDILNGLCISADIQRHKEGWQYFFEDCNTQTVDWFANEKWVVCENPGEYVSGLTHEIGGRIGFDGITHMKCCKPRLLPLKDQPEPQFPEKN